MEKDLTQLKPYTTGIIQAIKTKDPSVKDFIFTLGCYEGQPITLISAFGSVYIVNINHSRYSIDADLAKSIILAV